MGQTTQLAEILVRRVLLLVVKRCTAIGSAWYSGFCFWFNVVDVNGWDLGVLMFCLAREKIRKWFFLPLFFSVFFNFYSKSF